VSDLLKEAIEGLHINVPIYRTEERNGQLILYLYGGRTEHWPPTLAPAGDVDPPDLVTTSPTLATAGSSPIADLVTIPTPLPPGGGAGGEVPDDLTAITAVGKATAKALHNAGFHTFQDLVNADDTQLLDVPHVNKYVLTKLRSYLYTHYL